MFAVSLTRADTWRTSTRFRSISSCISKSSHLSACVYRKPHPFDQVTEWFNVDHDGRADIPLLESGCPLLKSRGRLEAENAALRHRLIVLQRKVRGRRS
jgi:hypothetical protein